ncbi:acetylglutamate kinase [Desulfitibacter alkalitolerans]|uniref:acetylglutamate kinase n=1 Tax=Desulfitibacter alkalitolerans TaxID=264641 RepID=UPI000487C80B|nr:acetylglutamate kinase [Desulfitibacter alkalitolerans]
MDITPLQRANVLVEALPYIKEFYGKTIVIKFGGHAMVNEELKQAVAKDCVLMKYVGMNPVIVHGGGPEISSLLNKLGKKSTFVNGLRITDAETMEVVEMVLVGKVNKSVVSSITRSGGKALGFSGKDGQLIEAVPHMVTSKNSKGETITHDLGFVGEVKKINPDIIKSVIEQSYIPVVAPIGVDDNGQSYNINADYVAGEMAKALGADKMILLTDVKGILKDRNDENSLISVLKVGEVPNLIEKGVISEGMIPKIQCCIQALKGGVKKTHIIDGRIPHSPLLEVFTNQGVGTMVEL